VPPTAGSSTSPPHANDPLAAAVAQPDAGRESHAAATITTNHSALKPLLDEAISNFSCAVKVGDTIEPPSKCKHCNGEQASIVTEVSSAQVILASLAVAM